MLAHLVGIPVERADLLFYGLDHSGPSYKGRVFIDPRGVGKELEPATRIVTVTDTVRDLLERGIDAAKVTVVARSEGREPNDVLAFDTVRLATYA